ncbi:nitroreductase family protein [Aeromicrobium sp. Leaf350]|uniref:nitroreductase family protein n=1 Tax=Aeromicrobium sp. Leaf350 TaxID=2876565 RepID=UPI001E427D0C|nr:nitroreductase family protein [Aeromicrobium sp. Leaf350]
MTTSPVATTRRAATSAPIHDLLAERWSPRSYDADHEIGDDEVTALLEAARWAPSAQNRQPRRFLVGRRGTAVHAGIASAINERNQVWAPRASLLVLGLVERVGADGARQRFSEYDLGQAVAHLSIQAQQLGLSVRQMGGFDPAVAARALAVDPRFEPFVTVAVGRATPADELEPEFAPRDTAPRERLPIDEVVLRRD